MGTIVLQYVLPDKLVLHPHWLLPAISTLLLIALVALGPGRVTLHHPRARTVALALVAVVSVANGWSAVLLAYHILNGTIGDKAGPLLASGASVYLTNIVVFALWYWEFDRGGPRVRAEGTRTFPDLMFPQMTDPEMAPKDWEPTFVDYFYVSCTNATAFSPTDTMPMTRWAKMTMLIQSSISLLLVALVIARAVGILQ